MEFYLFMLYIGQTSRHLKVRADEHRMKYLLNVADSLKIQKTLRKLTEYGVTYPIKKGLLVASYLKSTVILLLAPLTIFWKLLKICIKKFFQEV